MVFEALNASLLASETISRAMKSAANATEIAGDEAVQTGVEFGALGEALENVDDDAMAMAVGSKSTASAVDEMGDEALSSAAEVQALDEAMEDLNRTSGGLSARLGGIGGRFSTIATLAAAATPAVLGLGSALAGLGAAGATAAGGIAAIAAAGLQRKAEQMAASSAKLKNSGKAMQKIFKNVKEQIKAATEPLQTAANTQFAMSGLQGLVQLVHIASEGLAQMAGTLRQVGRMFGATVLQTAPAIFDQLDQTLQALMPSLRAVSSAIRDIPELIAFVRESAIQLQSELISLGGSAVGAAAGVAKLGTDIIELLIPPITVALDLLGWLSGMLSRIPGPLQAAAGAAIVAGYAYTWYTGTAFAATVATEGLIAALATLTAPISATAVAIGALIGAVVGVITYFGWWGDIIGYVTGAWNALVSIVEFATEVTYGMMLAIEDLFGPILLLVGGPLATLIWTIANLGEIIKFVGGVFEWFMNLVNTVISTVMGWVDTAISAIQQLMDWAMAVVNAIPGVSVDFGDVKKTIELDALKASEETKEEPKDEEKGRTKKEAKNHYDFRGADFSGTSQSQVEQTVAEAIRKANSESRSREDAQQF